MNERPQTEDAREEANRCAPRDIDGCCAGRGSPAGPGLPGAPHRALRRTDDGPHFQRRARAGGCRDAPAAAARGPKIDFLSAAPIGFPTEDFPRIGSVTIVGSRQGRPSGRSGLRHAGQPRRLDPPVAGGRLPGEVGQPRAARARARRARRHRPGRRHGPRGRLHGAAVPEQRQDRLGGRPGERRQARISHRTSWSSALPGSRTSALRISTATGMWT